MSLTSIMREGFSKEVVVNVPIPKNQFKFSKECIACPRTKNYALIGTAFDYLLRSELKRLHPYAIENEFIAEDSVNLVGTHIQLIGYFQARNMQVTERELSAMVNVAKEYKEKRAAFLSRGILTRDFVEVTIRFARMDSIFRAGVYDDVEKEVDPLDIEDMIALYNLIPDEFKKSSAPILLDPTFGEASKKVGGADVDLIMGDTIIDIKTTKEMKLDEYVWSQIVGYLVLADEAHTNDGILPKIENLGLYFSRYGYLWKINASYVRGNRNYEEVKRKLLEK
ncbi:MAG: hypothetical protein ACP5OE_08445 [Thermodesulfobium sp.]